MTRIFEAPTKSPAGQELQRIHLSGHRRSGLRLKISLLAVVAVVLCTGSAAAEKETKRMAKKDD